MAEILNFLKYPWNEKKSLVSAQILTEIPGRAERIRGYDLFGPIIQRDHDFFRPVLWRGHDFFLIKIKFFLFGNSIFDVSLGVA